MAKLAIKGHKERGEEVIEILEMLGGGNTYAISTTVGGLYTISKYDNRIVACSPTDKFVIFTLEQFEEKFPYKVGDKVSSKYLKNYEIEKMEWEDTNNRVIYKLRGMGWYSADELQPYKEETMEEKKINQMSLANCGLDEVEIVLGDKFELVNREGKYYAVRKKPEYPKTYEECCEVLLLKPERATYSVSGLEYKRHLIVNLQRLIICRDAYWKVAGGWKPDVMCCDLYRIGYDGNVITWEMQGGCRLLAFPTEEMRDAFYENFKDLIEKCKELL